MGGLNPPQALEAQATIAAQASTIATLAAARVLQQHGGDVARGELAPTQRWRSVDSEAGDDEDEMGDPRISDDEVGVGRERDTTAISDDEEMADGQPGASGSNKVHETRQRVKLVKGKGVVKKSKA